MTARCEQQRNAELGFLSKVKDRFSRFTDPEDLNARAMGTVHDDIVP